MLDLVNLVNPVPGERVAFARKGSYDASSSADS